MSKQFAYLPDVDSSFQNRYNRLTMHLHQEHLLYLARSITPLGTVHFADTYTGLQNSPTRQERRLVAPEVINPVLQQNFTPVKKETQWIFDHTPQERQFHITSHSLEPKPDNTKA